jgi:hypothetical protein
MLSSLNAMQVQFKPNNKYIEHYSGVANIFFAFIAWKLSWDL